LVLENASYHQLPALFPNLTLIASLQLPVLTSGEQKDKKSQILVQQNLASEEGDEKQ
jgi:hypothetical protein